MDDTRYMESGSGPDDGNTDKASFGKDHIGLKLLQYLLSLPKALNDLEGIREILYIKITSEFAGGNTIIGNMKVFDQFLFDAIIGTDIRYFKACLL